MKEGKPRPVGAGRLLRVRHVQRSLHELVRHGPYARIRHPIYTALLAMFLGTAVAAGTLAALIGIPLVMIGIRLKAGQEEALMSEHFPAEYAAYRSQAGALVPRLF